jgi:hypothetical protein
MTRTNSVFEKAREIKTVSADASTLYAENQAILVHRVGDLMQSAPNLSELLADSSLELMFEHHRHQARFMINALHFNLSMWQAPTLALSTIKSGKSQLRW